MAQSSDPRGDREWHRPSADFWIHVVATESGCQEWTGARDEDGYGRVRSGDGERVVFAHRVAFELGHGVSPGTAMVCHRCDNPPCCARDHLFLGTRGDNNRDAVRKGFGRAAVGEGNHQAKLSDADVDDIRSASACGVPQKVLAIEYGVHQSTISRILGGQRRALVALGRGCHAA